MSQCRDELTDFEWSIIAPLLPNKPRGVARVDDRRVLNGIYWGLRTGSPWATSPNAMAPIRRAITASCGGRVWGCGVGYSRLFQRLTKARNSLWTGPRSAFTSTEPTQKRGRGARRNRRSG